MLKHSEEFHVYREHPVLDAIEQCLVRLGDANLAALLRTYLAFLYPKTIAVSFLGFPLTYALSDGDSAENMSAGPSFSDASALEKMPGEDAQSNAPVDGAMFLSFLDQLVQCLRGLNFRPIFLLDLRGQRILDEPLLIKSRESLKGIARQTLLLVSSDVKQEWLRDFHDESSEMFSAAGDLKNYLRNLCSDRENSVELKLPSSVTLASLDRCIGGVALQSELLDKYTVGLDLARVNSISFFSMQHLVVLMHAVSRRNGNLWSISSESSAATRKLSFHRFFEVSSPILDRPYISPNRDTSKETLIEVQNSCGVYVFDHTLQSKLTEVTDRYMATLRGNYSRHLDQYVSYTDSRKHVSYKPAVYRDTYYRMIRFVISEFIENVILHSAGLGFFAALAKDNVLSLYIGDCGVGVRRGILKNYDLSDVIGNDRQALEYMFQLDSFRQKRRETHAFNEGAGFGLRDALQRIFACKGKFICRTGDQVAAFMNPVSKTVSPTFRDSLVHVDGTQFMIMIPLSGRAVRDLPRGAAEFLGAGV